MTYRECIKQSMSELGYDESMAEGFMDFMIQNSRLDARLYLDEECPSPESLNNRMHRVVEEFKKRQANQ